MKINSMQKKVSILIMLTLIFTMMFAAVSNVNAQFSDLAPNHWCYNKIVDFLEKGYVEGYSDSTFRADRIITRAEYVKIVNNFFGYSLGDASKVEFKDVKSTDWFAPYVQEAVSRGYIEGYEDNTFRPYEPIRRQEATVILSRILKIDNETYAKNHKDGMQKYLDGKDIDEWAYKAIHSYSVYGFISGYPDGTIRLKRDVTRAETVELLNVLEQKIVIHRPSTSKPKVLTPDITLWNNVEYGEDTKVGTELKIEEATWINLGMATWRAVDDNEYPGIFVNITDMTTGSTINEITSEGIDPVDGKGTAVSRSYLAKQETKDLENAFFLRDGVHGIIATATKSGYRDGDKVEKIVKVDTVAPEAIGEIMETTPNTGVAHKQSIKVKVTDPTTLTTNISGLDTSKLRFAWFKMDEIELEAGSTGLPAPEYRTYTRITDWTLFENDEELEAPTEYGTYKLGISAYDIAGNTYGTETDDVYGIDHEKIEEVPFDFVNEIENEKDIIVIVGNNAPIAEDLVMYTKINETVKGTIIATDIDEDTLYYAIKGELESATLVGNETTFISSKAGTYNYVVEVDDKLENGKVEAKVKVIVYDVGIVIPPENPGDEPIDVLTNGLTLYVGEEKDISASLIPDAETGTYNWELVDTETAQISITGETTDTLKVKGLIPGKTNVKVTAKANDITIEKTVEVKVISKITVTANNKSKVYGELEPTLDATVEGTIGEDTVVYTLSRVVGENVGEYVITPVGDTTQFGGCYEITFKTGTLEITAKDVTVTANNKTKVYGEVEPTLDATVEGTIGEDTVVYTLSRATGEDVGKYDITPSGNETQGNYKVTFEKGELEIKPISDEVVVTITENSDEAKYDGREHKIEGYIVKSISNSLYKNTDFTFNGIAEVTKTNAGTYNMELKSSDFTNTNTNFTNVKFVIEDGSLVISKRDVVLTSASDEKGYNGVALTNNEVKVSGDGFVAGEGATYSVTGSQLNVGTSNNAFTYSLNDNTLEANYNISKTEGTLEVTAVTDKVTVTITEKSAKTKYDGTEHKVEGYEVKSISNLLYKNTDFTFNGKAKVTETNAGTYNMELKSSDFTNTNTNFTNVEFVIEDGSLVISKRDVVLTSASDKKVYNGVALTNNEVKVSGDGFVAGEGATYSVTGSQLDVGTSKNAFTYILKENTKADNYSITKTEGDLVVTKITNEIVVKANSSSREYNGLELKNDGFTHTGELVEGDILSAVVEGTITDVGTKPNEVTSYKVMRGETDVTANYTFGTSVAGELKVTAKDVTVTANNKTKVYGEKDPTFDAKVEGTIGEDTVTYTFSRASGEDVGNYAITPSGNEIQGNYKVIFKDGELNITKIATEIIITADSNKREYDGNPLTDNGYTYTENVLLEGDVLEAIVEGTITDVGTKPNEVTSYKVMRGETDVTANYTFGTSVDGELKVTAKNVTVTANNKTKVYGDAEPTFDAKVEGTIGEDTVVYTLSRVAGENVGKYDITPSGEETQGNYKVIFKDGELEITKITTNIIITANSDSRAYNGLALTNTGFDYTKGVLVSGDTLTATVSGTITNVGTIPNKVTSYKVMRGTLDVTNNYTFGALVDGELEVTKKEVTLESATDSKDFDNTPLTNSNVTATGFVSGEGATYSVTGSQTAVGTSKNEFTYTLNEGTLEGNYKITKVEGDLTVNAKKNVTYKVEHYKELLMGGYADEPDATDTLKGTADGSTKATYTAKSYNGFTFASDLTAPSDLTILPDGSLVIKLYYARNTYTVTFNENYGLDPATVAQSFKTDEAKALRKNTFTRNNFEFKGWAKTSSGTKAYNDEVNYKMGTENVTLYAVWEEILPKATANITSNYPSNGKEAEPGTEITYAAEIKNKEANAITTNILLSISDADIEETYEIKYISSSGSETTETKTSLEGIVLPAGGSIIITLKATVDNCAEIGGNVKAEVEVKYKSLETGNLLKIAEDSVTNKIEKSVNVVTSSGIPDKNIVLILDLSRSMKDDLESLQDSVVNFITAMRGKGNTKLTLVTFWEDAHIGGTYDINDDTTYDNLIKNGKWNKGVIYSLKTFFGTNISDSLDKATTVLNNKSTYELYETDSAKDFVVFFGDGEPYNGETNLERLKAGSIKNLANTNADIYAIAFGDASSGTGKGYSFISAIVGADTTKLFTANNSTGLSEAFGKIAEQISAMQSSSGRIEAKANLEEGELITSVTIKWTNEDGTETTKVIDTIAKLNEMKVDITRDGDIIWDMSGTEYSEKSNIKISCTAETVSSLFTVTARFHNGADVYTQTIDRKVATNLDANTFEKTDYTFGGWAITEGGEVAYEDEASVTLKADLDLYAIWNPTIKAMPLMSVAPINNATLNTTNLISSEENLNNKLEETLENTEVEDKAEGIENIPTLEGENTEVVLEENEVGTEVKTEGTENIPTPEGENTELELEENEGETPETTGTNNEEENLENNNEEIVPIVEKIKEEPVILPEGNKTDEENSEDIAENE